MPHNKELQAVQDFVKKHRHFSDLSTKLLEYLILTSSEYSQGDIFYIDANKRVTRLAIGAADSILNSSGTLPQYTAIGGNAGGTIGALTVTDLTITSEAQGTILYFNGTNWVILAVGTSGQFLQTKGASANPVWADSSGGNDPVYGDGSDEAVTISSNVNLTRNMYYSSLTVNSTNTLDSKGYWIFCTGIVTNNGTIARNGNNGGAGGNGSDGQGGNNGGQAGAAGTAGAIVADGKMSGALAGEPGGAGGAGSTGGGANGNVADTGINQTTTLVGSPADGSSGGSGGDGNGAFVGGTGGSGGNAGTNTAAGDIPRDIFRAGIMKDFGTASSKYQTSASAGGSGGGGGGEGADDAGNNVGGGGGGGGGSGSGGGMLVIFAKTITNTNGIISANGGNGGAGGSGGNGSTTGNTGGGGGGGGGAGGTGGVVILAYQTLSSGTESVTPGTSGTGGTGGTGNGTGTNGSVGGTPNATSTGLLIKITT